MNGKVKFSHFAVLERVHKELDHRKEAEKADGDTSVDVTAG